MHEGDSSRAVFKPHLPRRHAASGHRCQVPPHADVDAACLAVVGSAGRRCAPKFQHKLGPGLSACTRLFHPQCW